jgi:hypothetical protein
MASIEIDTGLDETAEILAWRYETLLQAGYADREALLLATADEVDLHLACDLVARGCPAPTAVRILV